MVSSRSLTWAIPALMKTSTLPSSLATRSTSPKTASRSETSAAIATDRRPRALTSLGHLLGTFGVNVVDGDVGPVGGQPERDGPADSPRRAGYDGHLPLMLLMGTYLLAGASSGL